MNQIDSKLNQNNDLKYIAIKRSNKRIFFRKKQENDSFINHFVKSQYRLWGMNTIVYILAYFLQFSDKVLIFIHYGYFKS